MTIRFATLKVRLLANPEVKAEYDALASSFEKRASRRTRFAEAPPPQPSPASAGEGAQRRRRARAPHSHRRPCESRDP